MMKKKLLLYFMAFIFLVFESNAQKNILTHLKKSEKIGDKMFYNFSYTEALDAYQIAYNKDTSNIRIFLKIAESYRMLNEPSHAEEWYQRVVKNDQLIEPIYKLHYAQMLMSVEKYDEAKIWYKKYEEDKEGDSRSLRKLEGLGRIEDMFIDSVYYELAPIDINSGFTEFSPTIYQDGIVFVSSRPTNKYIKNNFNWDESNYLDLFYSKENEDGTYLAPTLFNTTLNTDFHEGPSIFYENNNKIIFTRNNYNKGKEGKSSDGIVKLKLYSSEKITESEEEWSKPIELSFNDDEYSRGHPAVTADGKTLYFVSDVNKGLGGADIYKSIWQDNTWSTPENMGNIVNTEGNEMFPFIHNDSVLYFASDGQGGLGGLDIYKYNLITSELKNMGYPINSSLDDFGFVLMPNGESGYVSSNRKGGQGKDDIYHFILKKKHLDILVYDESTNNPITNSFIKVESVTSSRQLTTNHEGVASLTLLPGTYKVAVNKQGYVSNQKKITISLDQEGKYKMPLKQLSTITNDVLISDDKNVLIAQSGESTDHLKDGNISKNNTSSLEELNGKDLIFANIYNVANLLGENQSFIIVSNQIFLLKENTGKFQYVDEKGEVFIELPEALPSTKNEREKILQEATLNTKYIINFNEINNIYYDFDSYIIRNDASVQLDKLVALLNLLEFLNVELSAYTDSRGLSSYNDKLAINRVKAAKAYLMDANIAEERIETKSFGELKLVNGCGDNVSCNENNHQLNRRTEFKLIFD